MAHRRLVTLTIAAALVFSLLPASAPQAVDAASCPDPKTAGPQHKTASGFLLPDSGNPSAGCAPQAVDSNWGPNSAGVLAHGCEGTFPNQDNLPNRVTPAWAWLSDQPQIATGTVVTPAAATDRIDGAFVRHSDFPVNHDSHDLDIFVALDNPSLGLMATGNYLRPLDDSGNPEEPEVNRLEVEWEAGRFEVSATATGRHLDADRSCFRASSGRPAVTGSRSWGSGSWTAVTSTGASPRTTTTGPRSIRRSG